MTSTIDLSNGTMVVGAGHGWGRGITTAFTEAGASVVAVARPAAPLAVLAHGAGRIQPEIADAADARVAPSLLDRQVARAVILVAGAIPLIRPLQDQTVGGVLGQPASATHGCRPRS